MSHKLIVGRTEFGKTRAAKILAGELIKKGGRVLVYDILGSQWPAGVVITTNRDEFLYLYWSETSWSAVFIDESGETVERGDNELEKTATRGRHQGHQNFYIVQGLTLMSNNARDQATGVYLFNCKSDDAERLYAAFGKKRTPNDPYLRIFEATNFSSGEFLYFTASLPPIKYKVNFEQNKIEKVSA